MANVISALKVLIGVESDGLQSGLDKTQQAAQTWAGRMKTIIGTVSFAGISVGALGAARTFEEASVQIGHATGAIGTKLDELNKSFVNVYKQADESSTEVAQALSLISSRTGATGKSLEELTLQMLELGKVQHEDIAVLTPLVTRVFGDWSISTERQGKAMEFLRVVSQQTGTNVSRLSEQVVYAGAPLRMLGYTFEQSAAMIGKFEKEGVNTELVLGGMKAALQKFAKEGVTDTAAAWQDFVEKVRSGSITMAEVIALVGVKRAPDLYRAILEGRFEIEKFTESLKVMADKGGESVTTMREKFKMLSHQVEALIGQHYQLIMVLGATVPALASIGTVAIPVFGGMMAVVGNITTALRFGLVGALSAVETAIAASGIVALLAAIGYTGYKAGDALQKKFAPGVDTTRDALRNIGVGVTRRPTMAEIFAQPSPASAAKTPTGVLGGSPAEIPAYLNATNIDTLAQIGILERLRGAWGTAKHAVIEFILASEPIGKKLPYDFASLNNRVLDFATVSAQAVIPIKQIEQINWPIAGIEKTDAMMAQLGLTSTHALRMAADQALALANALEIAREAGQATASDVTAAAEAAAKAHKALQDRIDGTADASKKATKAGVDFGRQVSTVLTDLSRSLADVVMGEKAIGDAFKDVGRAIVRIILEDIIANAIGKLMKALAGILDKLGGIGKALGGLIGGGGGGGGVGSVSSAGGSADSGIAGSAVSTGLAATVGMVTGAISAVSGVIGNFQMAGMNKSLDLIENYTRYTKIYTGEQSDSILETLHLIRNKWYDFMSWTWDVHTVYLQKMTAALEAGGSGGGGGRALVTITGGNYYGTTPDAIAQAIIRQARLSGAAI